jgi:hypothetical protein
MTHAHAFRWDPPTDSYRCACGAVESKLARAYAEQVRAPQPCTHFEGHTVLLPSLCINCGWSAGKHLEAQLPDRVRSGRERLSC